MIGNGSFGVVYQARLIDSQEMVAIKKVLQDKRFKVIHTFCFLSAVLGSDLLCIPGVFLIPLVLCLFS